MGRRLRGMTFVCMMIMLALLCLTTFRLFSGPLAVRPETPLRASASWKAAAITKLAATVTNATNRSTAMVANFVGNHRPRESGCEQQILSLQVSSERQCRQSCSFLQSACRAYTWHHNGTCQLCRATGHRFMREMRSSEQHWSPVRPIHDILIVLVTDLQRLPYLRQLSETTFMAPSRVKLKFVTKDFPTKAFPFQSSPCNLHQCTTAEGKQLLALLECYEDLVVQKSGRKWCLIGDDDTYFVLNKWMRFLAQYNASAAHYFGCYPFDLSGPNPAYNPDCPVARTATNPTILERWKEAVDAAPPKYYYNDTHPDHVYTAAEFGWGGLGHVISVGTLEYLGYEHLVNCKEQHVCSTMDVRVAQCLYNSGMAPSVPLTNLNLASKMPCFGTMSRFDRRTDFCSEFSPTVGAKCFSHHKTDFACTAVVEAFLYSDDFLESSLEACCGWREGWIPRWPSRILSTSSEYGSESGIDECYKACKEEPKSIAVSFTSLGNIANFSPPHAWKEFTHTCSCWEHAPWKKFPEKQQNVRNIKASMTGIFQNMILDPASMMFQRLPGMDYNIQSRKICQRSELLQAVEARNTPTAYNKHQASFDEIREAMQQTTTIFEDEDDDLVKLMNYQDFGVLGLLSSGKYRGRTSQGPVHTILY